MVSKQPSRQQMSIDTIASSGFRYGHYEPIDFDVSIRARVVRLLLPCRPSAIARFVISIVTWKPVERMLRRWSESHVSQESREIVYPLRAHSNAATSVVVILTICCLIAPTFCVMPSLVLWAVSPVPVDTRRMPVTKQPLAVLLGPETITALCQSSRETLFEEEFLTPAVTSAETFRAKPASATSDNREHDQTSKSLSKQSVRHQSIIYAKTHYYAPASVTKTPAWAAPPAVRTTIIAAHAFYKNVA